MSELQKFWAANLSFQRTIIPDWDQLSNDAKQSLTKDYVIHLNSESIELLNAIKWKIFPYRAETEVSTSKIREELIDAFKFLVNIALLWGVTPEEFTNEFVRKSDVNEAKYSADALLNDVHITDKDVKTCIVDIDGILAAYPERFISFVNAELDSNYSINDVQSIEAPLLDKIGVDNYQKLKWRYRDLGLKKTIEPMEHASKFTWDMKAIGFKIILLSSRPVEEHKRIYADTLEWLKANNICYDAIFWSKDKLSRTLGILKPEFIVDDNPDVITQLEHSVKKCYLLRRPYNRLFSPQTPVYHSNIEVIRDLLEIPAEYSRNFGKEIEA